MFWWQKILQCVCVWPMKSLTHFAISHVKVANQNPSTREGVKCILVFVEKWHFYISIIVLWTTFTDKWGLYSSTWHPHFNDFHDDDECVICMLSVLHLHNTTGWILIWRPWLLWSPCHWISFFMQHRTTKLQLLKDLEKSLKKPNDFHENRHRSLFSTPHRTLAVHGALAGAQ